MVVAFDNAAGSTAASWSHVNNGTAIVVAAQDQNSGNNITAVTYGGVPLTKLGFTGSAGGTWGVVLWGRAGGLPSGANTLSVSGTWGQWGGVATYSGASRLGTPVTGRNGTAGTGSITVTGTTTGGLVVTGTVFGSQTTGATAASPAVKRWDEEIDSSSSAGNGWLIDQASAGGGASTTVTWTDIASDAWGMVAVELLPGTWSGPNPAGAGADLGGGTGTWTGPGNITADDASAATWAVT